MEKPGKSRIGWPFRIGRALGLVALGILCVSGVHGTANPWESYRLYLQGLLAERAGRLVQAMEVYQKVIDRDPGEGFLHESLAGVALAAGRGDLALVAARQAVLLSTGSAGAYLLLGRVYLARGEHSSAEEAFDQALKLDPSNVEALGWAASRRPLSDPQGARRLFDRFLSSNPEADHVRYGLAEIQERQGDLSAAEASYKKIIQSDPSHREARLGLAALFDVQGDTRAAINAYEEILETETDNVEVLTRLGQLYLLTSQLAEARDLFDRAIVLVPENSGIHFWRALVAQEESQWRDAVRHMEQAAKENPEPGVLLRLASYHGRLDHPKEAIRVLHRLRRTQPENPDFMYYLALAYEEGGNPRAAIRWLNRAVAKNPGNPDFHFHLGLNWDKRKRFDRAETHLLRTIDLEPTHHLALNYLGYSWADRNEHVPEALDLIQRAVSLDPDNTAYRDSLGWAFFRLGRFGEAETALGPVVYQANDPVVWSHYGDVLKALGREREAVRAWQEGLLVGPDDAHLLKRLGVQGRMSHVTPLSAPRTLLKRVEGNFRQVTSLSGVAAVRVRSAGQTLNGQGLFYYARPGLFRVEILGPFFTPQAVLVYDGEVHWSPEVGTPADETAWLALWAEVLSGDFFKRFDDPSVEVHQEGSTLLYVAPGGELRLDAQHKNILEAQRHVPGNAPVRLSFQGSKEIEGIRFPRVVEGQSLTNDFHFALEFSRLTVNPSLKSSLFKPVP